MPLENSFYFQKFYLNRIIWYNILFCLAYLPTCTHIFKFYIGYRRLLRVPWTARRSSQSILKEISPEYSLEGLMLKLKLQYFGHLMQRPDSLKKTLMLGKTESKSWRGQQKMTWLDSTTDSVDLNLSKLQEIVNREAWHAIVHGVTKSRTQLSNWTTTSTASGYIHQVLIPRQKLVEHQNMPCWILTLNCSDMMCVMTCKLSQKPKFAKQCSLLIIYVKFHYENPFCHI